MPFSPYFSGLVKETIETQTEHDLLTRVMAMNENQLHDFRDDLNTEAAIDPSFRRTREWIVGRKAVIRRAQQIRQGRRAFAPFFEFLNFIDEMMIGMIVTDEWFKRFLGEK